MSLEAHSYIGAMPMIVHEQKSDLTSGIVHSIHTIQNILQLCKIRSTIYSVYTLLNVH